MKTGNRIAAIKRALKKITGLTYYVVIGMSVSVITNIFVCQSVSVSGSSMEPSYHDGDRHIMEKVSYRVGGPERFDVVVFPRGENYYLVKRIIGLPGETVRINSDSEIFINGMLLEENYGMEPIRDAGIAEHAVILGSDEYFVLGDNRNNSADSRNAGIGNVRIGEISGKIMW
jgi:signal peptidase I, bacterial type